LESKSSKLKKEAKNICSVEFQALAYALIQLCSHSTDNLIFAYYYVHSTVWFLRWNSTGKKKYALV